MDGTDGGLGETCRLLELPAREQGLPNAGTQFRSGFLQVGDGNETARIDAAVAESVCDGPREPLGLAGAGTRIDEGDLLRVDHPASPFQRRPQRESKLQ